MHIGAALAAVLCLSGAAAADQSAGQPGEARVLRFPTSHGDKIVFGWAGDLYTVAASGGVARRLTSHPGYEMFPRFSPDGKSLAFTGQYDGNTEVYVMPADGGTPRRLTYTATLGRDDVSDRMGPNNIVMGWTPDGKHVLFRSRMNSFNDFIGQLFLVPAEGGLADPLPLPRGGFASYSPDGSKLAFNRIFREFRTWKRYRGGMADDVWIYDFATRKTTDLTNTPAQEVFPMWSGNRIYFLSDRESGARMNLHVTDLGDNTTRQLTHFKDFDVKFPSLGDKAIVFEQGGWLWRFDLADGNLMRVPVWIHEDAAIARGGVTEVGKSVTNFDIAPDGKRALFGARGDVFTVPAKHGPTRNLSATPGVHERDAEWSPDGKLIAFISDATGEDEVHVISPDGKGTPRRLTDGADTYKFAVHWSPDSKKILWSDRKLRLQYVDVATRAVKLIRQAPTWEIRGAVWSPDSRWVAWSEQQVRAPSRVWLANVDDGKTYTVTDGGFDSFAPCFSGDGKYLFFVSLRDFNPVYSQTEFNHAYQDMARIYLVTLAKDAPSPWRPRSDEVGEDDKPKAEKKEEKPKAVVVKVDPEGIQNRVLQLPVQPANYGNLHSVGDVVYYMRRGSKDAKPAFEMYDLGQRKETSLGSVSGYEISADGKKMIVSQDGKYGIIDLPKGPVTVSEPLNLSAMEVKLDRRAEWEQIYRECWRQMRDFFYDPNMHGVDWPAMRARYEPLVAHVGHRADLTYIIGEMIGELNVGHAYVGGGDMPHPQRLPLGLLGARLKRDPDTGFYQIVKIFKGERWDPHLHSPLNDLGVDAKEGDWIVAVNGRPLSGVANIYETLVNQADKPVTLKLNTGPRDKRGREVIVMPIESEAPLYYHEWVTHNRDRVSEATGGQVAYVHVPDMQTPGLNEFARQFYPQLGKKALIVDVRGNGGGNVSAQLIERLRREAVMMDIARNGRPNTDPREMIHGPMVCLLNEFSASDGDIFPFRFRKHGMGKLIGKRSWGGVVGIRNTLPLLDGGFLNRPEFATYATDGKSWIIEGVGVEPDIFVDNDPGREFAGTDDQLERAIVEIQTEMKMNGKVVPPPPPFPRK
jgi:tricorn protease